MQKRAILYSCGKTNERRSLVEASSEGLYEYLCNSVRPSNCCLDLWLDRFPCSERVDSPSACACGDVAHFAFRSRQTRGSRPAHREMIPRFRGSSQYRV